MHVSECVCFGGDDSGCGEGELRRRAGVEKEGQKENV